MDPAAQAQKKDDSVQRPPPPGTERRVELDAEEDAAAIAAIEGFGTEDAGDAKDETPARGKKKPAAAAPPGRKAKEERREPERKKATPARSKAPPEEDEEEEPKEEAADDADRTERDGDYAREDAEAEEAEDDGSKIDHKALAEKHRARLKAQRDKERRRAQEPPDEDQDLEDDEDLDLDEEEDEDSEQDEQDEDDEDDAEDDLDADEDDEEDDTLDSARPSAEERARPRRKNGASGQQRPAPAKPGSGEGGPTQSPRLFTKKEFAKLSEEGFDKSLIRTLKRADQRFQTTLKTHAAQMQAVTRVARTLIEQDTIAKGSALRSFLAAKAKEGFHDVYGRPGARLTEVQDAALAKVIKRAHGILRDEAREGNYISFPDALEAAHGTVNYKRSLESARAQGRQDVESRIQKRHRKRDLVGGARAPGGARGEGDGGVGGSGGGDEVDAAAQALTRFAEKNKLTL